MQVVLPESSSAITVSFDQDNGISLAAYLAYCRKNPDLRVERSAEGEIIVMPPAGFESSHRNSSVTAQLHTWASEDGRGIAADSSAQFVLPDGSALSPDASWVSMEALRRIPRQKRKEFLPLAPEFVVEVLSPSDRLKTAKEKMELWIANGVQLAWLIDGDKKTVYVYRKRKPVKTLHNIDELAGEGPVAGFVLQLRGIWQGLG